MEAIGPTLGEAEHDGVGLGVVLRSPTRISKGEGEKRAKSQEFTRL